MFAVCLYLRCIELVSQSIDNVEWIDAKLVLINIRLSRHHCEPTDGDDGFHAIARVLVLTNG